ncbi:MAG: hypothetical protein HY288_14955, partial [Planctomycetia bacterium]|nr:hypothetical protein [Planctomycetia bacterium]
MNAINHARRNGSRGVPLAVVFSLAIGLAITIHLPARAGYQVIHTFTGGTSDGAHPLGSLIQSGSTLYGTTRDGGSSDYGTIFQVGTDGSGFSLLHNFTGGSSDGAIPAADLIRSGSTLYGTTAGGGHSGSPPNTGGTIFRVGTDGSGFSLLHSFTGVDGETVQGSLIQSGSTLYGMAVYGGSNGRGTIFKVGTDGSAFSLLHSFTGGSGDGGTPYGSLFQSGSILYGMTSGIANGDGGTIF